MKHSILIFALLGLWGCAKNENKIETLFEAETEEIVQLSEEQLKTFTLTSTALQEREITKTLRLNGEINVPPQNLVSISSALGGYVKSTKLVPGMYFKKGEVIAVMEDNQFIQLQQDYLTVKAQLGNAEAEYSRQKDLNQSKASSDKVYQQAKADYETLLISKNALEQKLKLIAINPSGVSVNNISETVAIYAPFDGYVSQVFVNRGKYVAPSDVLFELVNFSDLYLTLKIFEQDWNTVEVGQTVTAFSNSMPDRKYEATVIQTGKGFSADRSVAVYAKLKTVDAKLIPGMYMNAELVVPENKAMVLPEASVVSFEGKEYVFEILDASTFKILEVQIGSSGNGWVEITNVTALQTKKIANQGAYTLLMALKNKPEE